MDKKTGKPLRDKDGKDRFMGNSESTIAPQDYYAYNQYYKVRNEPFIEWFESLRPMQIKTLIVGGETPMYFNEGKDKFIEILVNLRKDAEKYFTKNKEYFDEKDDGLIKDILKTIKDAYIENKELDPDDIDDGSTGEFKNPEQQMDMENAQHRYDKFTQDNPRIDMTQKPKPSENLASDEYAESQAEIVRRKKAKTYYEQFGKMLLKADIESGYEDDVFYWMFFWMTESVRENMKNAFQEYSNLNFKYDDAKKVRLIDLLDPDFALDLPTEEGQYNVDAIKTRYRMMFLEDIYNKKVENKNLVNILEDIAYIPVLTEKNVEFASLETLDFTSYGDKNEFRESKRKLPEKVKVDSGRKKQTYRMEVGKDGVKRKVKDKIVPVFDYVPTRTNVQDRQESIEKILAAKNRFARSKARI